MTSFSIILLLALLMLGNMYPLYFYICLLASLAMVMALVLLAIFPIHLPIVPKEQSKAKTYRRPVRSPTRHPPYREIAWDDDEDDL